MNLKKAGSRSIVGFICVYLWLITPSFASVPQKISFQGRLADDNGIPITGTRDFTFKIYNGLTGGSASWTESQTAVSVQNGIWSVRLGEVTPISNTVFDGTTKYLEIQVGTDTLSPRMQMVSVPYAYRSVLADIASGVALSTVTAANIVDGTITNADLASDTTSLSKVTGGNMSILSNNIGIGTTNPLTKLYVEGGHVAAGANGVAGTLFLLGAGSGVEGGEIDLLNPSATTASGLNAWTIDNFNNDMRIFYNGGSTSMFFKWNGNVGVGTNSPETKLHLANGTLTIQNPDTAGLPGAVGLRIMDSLGIEHIGLATLGGYGRFRMSYSTPSTESGSIELYSGDGATANVKYYRIDSSYAGGLRVIRRPSYGEGETVTMYLNWTGGIIIPSLAGYGALYANSGLLTMTAPSSMEYKTDIEPINLESERLLSLTPKSFKWKSNNVQDFGYIAEEIRQIIPELYRDDGTTKGYALDKLPFYIIELLKSQQKQIEELKTEVQELKNR
jgi:hypothetical protein